MQWFDRPNGTESVQVDDGFSSGSIIMVLFSAYSEHLIDNRNGTATLFWYRTR